VTAGPLPRDIETRDDLERIVRAFYSRALEDEIIGPIFTDVAKLDLEAHVPVITSFWETLVLGVPTYDPGCVPPARRAAREGRAAPRALRALARALLRDRRRARRRPTGGDDEGGGVPARARVPGPAARLRVAARGRRARGPARHPALSAGRASASRLRRFLPAAPGIREPAG